MTRTRPLGTSGSISPMTLDGPQLDACDECGQVEEIRLTGGMMLCPNCEAVRCPRCGNFCGVYNPEWGHFDCPACKDSYIYRGA